MENNRINDKRVVKLDHVMGKDYIPYESGRPERATVIGFEDILNLRIALNTTVSFEEFLRLV